MHKSSAIHSITAALRATKLFPDNLCGACAVGAFALKELIGGEVYYGTVNGINHCWLENEGIYDPTASQFTGELNYQPYLIVQMADLKNFWVPPTEKLVKEIVCASRLQLT